MPSQPGRALSTRASRRVGVVSAELSNPFYPALLEPLHDVLEERGYRVILITDRGEVPVEIEPLIDGSLDGVLLTTSTVDSTLPHELSIRGLPFGMLNRVVPGVAGDACELDNRLCGRLAADFLVQLGHRDIGAVHGPTCTSTGHDRAAAFAERLTELGAPLRPTFVRRGPFAELTGREAVLDLVGSSSPSPTAVFCGNDVIALGVCNAGSTLGIDIGRDLTVVGVDDIPMAAWPVFDLTTFKADLHLLARAAADLLVTRMGAPGLHPRRVTVSPQLVLRGTHGAPVTRPSSGVTALDRL